MLGLDAAFEEARNIFQAAAEIIDNIVSEEDAKIQLITRILTEALGWDFKDISAERKNESGYSDYQLSISAQKALVLEAKRKGKVNLSSSATRVQFYKISGPALRDCLEGIEQAAAYCFPDGIQLAVLTDGITWIIFKPFIAGESYREKQAIVFPGYEAILADFARFYELLAKESVARGVYKSIFDRLHDNRLAVDRPLHSAIEDSDLRIEQKSSLAFDLDNVFNGFFSTLAGDSDPDLIINCFVETTESRVADFSLEKITANVLGNLAPPDRAVDEGLHRLIETTFDADEGQTVFIVGPQGAGKSTFLKRFFKKTLSRSIRERCVIVDGSALDSTGVDQTSLRWLTDTIIKGIEAEIFSGSNPTYTELQALYHGEYVRRSVGVDHYLYTRSKEAFKEKFGEYMREQVERDREGYLIRLLQDVVRNRKRLPIIVVDNTDEFNLDYKTQLFQYCQSLRRAAQFCLLIFPITDKSAWSFSKTDIFNIYSSKSFFLPTPSPREIFRKRVDYLKERLSESQHERVKVEYFLSRGIKVSIDDLAGFAAVVENIFVDQDFAAKRIGEIANYNIRKTLHLCKRVITSSVLKVEDIIRSYILGEIVTPSPAIFMESLLRGDYNFFKRNDLHYIISLFRVDEELRQSPLLAVRLLLLLRSQHLNRDSDELRYMSLQSIYRYFDVMGNREAAVEKTAIYLLESGLIETYDPSERGYSSDRKVAITYAGLAHLEMALFNSIYFEQMALTTRIADADVAATLRGFAMSSLPREEAAHRVRKTFAKFLCDEDGRFTKVPSAPEFREQAELANDILRQWTSVEATVSPGNAYVESRATFGPVLSNAKGFVDRFDIEKKYGFIHIPELKEQIFVHQNNLTSSGFGEIFEGDALVCDVSRGSRGLFVSKVHEVIRPELEKFEAIVIRLFPDRGYGFVRLPSVADDAFFHYSAMPEQLRKSIREGMKVFVSTKTSRSGATFQAHRIEPYTDVT